MKDPMYTSCSDWEEKLAAVHPDDLLPAERRAFNCHAAHCAACAAILADYLDIDALIRRSLTPRRPLELPQDFVFEIEQKTGEEQLVEQIFANQSIDLLQEAMLIVEEAQ